MSQQILIHKAFSQHKKLYSVFFGLQGAYDMVWWHHAQHRADSICGNMGLLIEDLLCDRHITVRLRVTHSAKHEIINGVLLDCVLSVTLFLLAIIDISTHIVPIVKFQFFANDLFLSFEFSSLPSYWTNLPTSCNSN